MVDEINKLLLDNFGKFNDQPRFRVVWANDQFEKRMVEYTPEGLELPEPKILEVPKYITAWHRDTYILEMLMPVGTLTDLVTSVSYEPVWTFRSQTTGEVLPPLYGACKMVAETIMINMQRTYEGPKYKDPESDAKVAPDIKLERIMKIEEELFGNETPLGDSLKRDTAVGYGTRQRSFS
jgi:hypothetical protein